MTTAPWSEVASVILDATAQRLEAMLRFAMAEGDRDNPDAGRVRLEQGTALVAWIRAEAENARLTEAMFATGVDNPTLVALLHNSYPSPVKAAVRYCTLVLAAAEPT